jgi:hypothetical protein
MEEKEKPGDAVTTLSITVKDGDRISILDGLVEIEVDFSMHGKRKLRFKAPRVVPIFRKKKPSLEPEPDV